MSSYIQDILAPIDETPIEVEVPHSDNLLEEIIREQNWEDYIGPGEIADILEQYNQRVGDVRHVSEDSCCSVLASAAAKYSDLDHSEMKNALLWDLHGFLEYATLGVSESYEFDDSYGHLLASGHPFEGSVNLTSTALWISGAPEVEESSRDAIVASISPASDEYITLHARTRLAHMIESDKLSENTIELIENVLAAN